MPTNYFILFLFFFGSISAQELITGKVLSIEKEPLENASVYFNHTSVGVITDGAGEFKIKKPSGAAQLVVSFIGFEPVVYNVKPDDINKSLVFLLEPQANMLDEVVIRKQKYDEEWYFNLNRFLKNFIGQSELAQTCELLNPKALYFSYNSANSTLTAVSDGPLLISNNGLGYIISFDLISFTLSKDRCDFMGYTKYEEMKGGKSKMRKWKKARELAYRGSMIHFFKSLQDSVLEEEGFGVNQFKRIQNASRPSEIQINEARAYLRKNKISFNLNKDVTKQVTKLDSSIAILKKVKLPRYNDILYRRNVPYKNIIEFESGTAKLIFKDYLSIIYRHEKEGRDYISATSILNSRAPSLQTSAITLLKETVVLNQTGVLDEPYAMFTEGYWAFEKMAEALPLNYTPIEK